MKPQKPSIWILRPKAQAAHLEATLLEKGYGVLAFPTIEIIPKSPHETAPASVDCIIVLSYNAAIEGEAYLKSYCRAGVFLLAIGKATATALESLGLSVDYIAPPPHTSEALLSSPFLSDKAKKTVLIVKGVGGRVHLEENLVARGFQVFIQSVYERRPIEIPLPLSALDVDWLLVSSAETLTQAMVLWRRQFHLSLQTKSLFVFSQRLAVFAKGLGFSKIIVAKEASEEAFLSYLAQNFE